MKFKYIVMVRYSDGDSDALSVWDTDEEAHTERSRLATVGPQSNKYWVRMTRHNAPYRL